MMHSKKVLMAAIIAVTSAQAAQAVISLDLLKDSGDRTLNSRDFVADSTGFRLRWGMGSIEDSRMEIYLSRYDVDDEGEFNDSAELEAGINYIVTFQNLPVIPFLKAGIGLGMADTNATFLTYTGDTTDNIWNVHFNLGGGLSYKITKNVAISGALEYVYRSWEDIDYGYSGTLSTSDRLFRASLGVDFSF